MLHNSPTRLLCALALFALSFSASASAQDTVDFFQAMGYTNEGGNVLSVEVNKGTTVRLGTPASSVAIADPTIADVQVLSPRMLFINGRGVGETSIIVVDAQDNIIYEGMVNVTHNLSRLKRAVAEMAPDSHIEVDSTDNAIILKGKVDSPVVAEKVQRLATSFLSSEGQSIINMMDTSSGDQVMLRVKIVEVGRSELKRLGINWESILNSGNFLFGFASGRDIVDATGSFTRAVGGDSGLGVGFRDGTQNINTMIDALEDDGLVSILAEPNLTTRSGQTASFLAGGEYPIPVPAEDGAVTIEYRQFGVSLQFTPIVMSKDKISLTVLPEVSALSDENSTTGAYGTIRALTTRRANTTVDLGSGQTFAIAGLLRTDNSNSNSKFPGLGDIPLVGTLFRSSESRNNQTEVVILVTPYIVQPTNDPKALATPADGLVPATDGERILLGRLHGEAPVPEAVADAPVITTADSKAAPVAPVAAKPLPVGAPTPTLAPAPAARPALLTSGQAGFIMR